MRKAHTRPALTWTAVSTITEFRSHQQALGNLTNAWTPVGLSPITLLSSFFNFNKSLGFTVSCVYHRSMNEGCKSSRWFSGMYTTWTTYSRHNTNQVIGTNILLIRVVSVGGTFWLLVPCMRKVHTKQLSRSRLVSCELFCYIYKRSV